MEYNKNKFTKVNDHKVLHKVKKQWVVMSMAMLALLGGGAVAHKVSAHADVANHINNNDILRARLNQSLVQIHNHQGQTALNQKSAVNNPQQPINNGRMNNTNNDSEQTGSNIIKQADVLHQRILRNADLNHNRQNSQTTNSLNNDENINNKFKALDSYEVQNTHELKDNLNSDPDANVPDNPRYDTSGISQQYRVTDTGSNPGATITLYNDGLLYMHDGYIGRSDAVYELKVDNNDPNGAYSNIRKIYTSNLYMNPDTAVNEFSSNSGYNYFPNLDLIDASGIHIVGNNVNLNDDFDWNYGLRYLIGLGHLRTPTVDSMAWLFGQDPQLRYVDLSSLDTRHNDSWSDMFSDDQSLDSITLGPYDQGILQHGSDDFFASTKFSSGKAWNSDGNLVNLTDTSQPHIGTFYAYQPVINTVNFIFNGSPIKTIQVTGVKGDEWHVDNVPDGCIPSSYNQYVFDTPTTWNVNVEKSLNVKYYYGSQFISVGKAYYSDYGNYPVDYSDCIGAPSGYAVDPRGSKILNIRADGSISDNNIQVDKTGQWGNATWYLTPDNNQLISKSGQPLPKGNLYIINGPINGNDGSNALSADAGLTASDMSDVHSISGNNVSVASDASHLFSSLKNLDNISDLSNWNVSDVNSLTNAFQSDDSLKNWTAIKDSWKFNSQPNTSNMFQNDSVINDVTPPTYQQPAFNDKWMFGVPPKVSCDAPITLKFVDSNNNVQRTASDQPLCQTIDVKLNGYVDSDTGFSTPIESNYTLVNTNNFKAKLHSTDPEWAWDTSAFSAHPEAESANYTNGDNWDSTKDRPMLVFKAGDAGNIILNYINQSGQPIDYSDNTKSADHVINSDNHYGSDVISGTGRYDDHVNVVNPNKQTPYSFNGYPNPDPQDYNYNSNNPVVNSDYGFTNNQQRVTIPLQGKSTSDQNDGDNALKVNFYAYDSYGNGTASPIGYKVIHIHSDIGSIATVKPGDFLASDGYGKKGKYYDSALDHYVADPRSSLQQYYLRGNYDGKATLYNVSDAYVKNSAEPNATVNFYYDASPNYSSDVGTITVKYFDQYNHQVSGEIGGKAVTSDVITPAPSDYGQKINVTNSDSKLTPKPGPGNSAQGMNVPSGYHLVDNPDVNYQITNHAQEADLHIQGNQRQINSDQSPSKTTSYSLPIHIVTKVYKSDGTTSDNTKQYTYTISDGQGHPEQFTKSVNDEVKPQLVGNVGDSDVISAASYQPQVNSDQQMVESTGTNKYNVHFNANGISVDNVTDPNNSGITFNYTIDDKPKARQRNYIHYISYSDVDNRGDITTQPHHQAFPTKVSDASDAGSTFNDQYYRENVPTGYQFYKVYSVNSDQNQSDTTVKSGLTRFGDGHGNPGEEYIEVIPNASPITFHYINQNGSDVKDVQVSGNGSQKNAVSGESNYTSNFGTKITSNQINKSDQPTSQLGVPQGYQYNALTDSQGKSTTIGETQPVFSRDPQDVYIPVTGKTYNKVNVQLQQDFSDANHRKFANSNYIYTINNAQVGHNYTIYGFNLNTPSAAHGSGYTLNQSGHPFKVTVHINPDNSYSFLDPSNNSDGRAEASSDQGTAGSTISVNNISDIKDNKNNNQIQFNPNTGNPTATNPPTPRASFWYHITNNASKPLTLIYINQAGQQVGCADKMQGTVGSDINVTDPSKGGEPLPADYTLDGGITPNKTLSDKSITNQTSNSNKDYSSDVTGTNQDTEYRFTDQPRTVYLHVTGNTHTTNITVYTVAKNSDGTTTFSHRPGTVSGSDGSLVSVSPETYNPNSSKYSVDYSKDSTQFVRLTRNQNGQVVATPNRIIFYYSNKTTDGAPITLRYINHKTGQEVGYTKVINGNLSDKVDVVSSDPTNGDLAGEDVPAGYTVDTNPKDLPQSNLLSGNSDHPVYKFSDSPQMLNIPVNGNPETLTYHIHVFKESSDGTIQGPASDVSLHITGNVGDTIHISPYNFTKKDASSDVKSITMSDNGHVIDSYGVPTGGSGYHATNTDLDKDIQINANGQLSPDSNTNYFYRQNYQGQQVGTVRIHYITGTINSGTTFDNTGAPTNDANQVDMVSDKGTIGNDYTHAGTFDLSPYRDDIPEELSTNYESADNAMNKDGTQIADNPSGNQWQYSESSNGFTNGIRDVYIQVKQRGTNGTDNGPIIIGSDGNMLNN